MFVSLCEVMRLWQKRSFIYRKSCWLGGGGPLGQCRRHFRKKGESKISGVFENMAVNVDGERSKIRVKEELESSKSPVDLLFAL